MEESQEVVELMLQGKGISSCKGLDVKDPQNVATLNLSSNKIRYPCRSFKQT